MKWLFDDLARGLAFICRILQVTPDALRQGRRGNLPPAQGAPYPEPR